MKEIEEILKRVAQFSKDERAILATVVDVIGSGYRRPGARMLIDKEGYSIGTVSGGCLEADVLERARKVLLTGEPTIIEYDTTADENSVFGLGMGCRGIVRILLENCDKESVIIKSFVSAIEKREKQIIATKISGEDNLRIGGRIFFRNNEDFAPVNLPETFVNLEQLQADCRELSIKGDKTVIKIYETDAGKAEFFIEQIVPPLNFLLFGAGFDALPVVRFAKEIGWRVTVVDHRAAFSNRERLPEADEIIVSRAEDLLDELFVDENAVAVVMTHNYDRDREILYRLLNSDFRYIGLLGPRKRTENLIQELRDAQRKFDEAKLKRIYAPVGLDIGSETPEEIALAIIAEIKTTLEARSGGSLREKYG